MTTPISANLVATASLPANAIAETPRENIYVVAGGGGAVTGALTSKDLSTAKLEEDAGYKGGNGNFGLGVQIGKDGKFFVQQIEVTLDPQKLTERKENSLPGTQGATQGEVHLKYSPLFRLGEIGPTQFRLGPWIGSNFFSFNQKAVDTGLIASTYINPSQWRGLAADGITSSAIGDFSGLRTIAEGGARVVVDNFGERLPVALNLDVGAGFLTGTVTPSQSDEPLNVKTWEGHAVANLQIPLGGWGKPRAKPEVKVEKGTDEVIIREEDCTQLASVAPTLDEGFKDADKIALIQKWVAEELEIDDPAKVQITPKVVTAPSSVRQDGSGIKAQNLGYQSAYEVTVNEGTYIVYADPKSGVLASPSTADAIKGINTAREQLSITTTNTSKTILNINQLSGDNYITNKPSRVGQNPGMPKLEKAHDTWSNATKGSTEEQKARAAFEKELFKALNADGQKNIKKLGEELPKAQTLKDSIEKQFNLPEGEIVFYVKGFTDPVGGDDSDQNKGLRENREDTLKLYANMNGIDEEIISIPATADELTADNTKPNGEQRRTEFGLALLVRDPITKEPVLDTHGNKTYVPITDLTQTLNDINLDKNPIPYPGLVAVQVEDLDKPNATITAFTPGKDGNLQLLGETTLANPLGKQEKACKERNDEINAQVVKFVDQGKKVTVIQPDGSQEVHLANGTTYTTPAPMAPVEVTPDQLDDAMGGGGSNR